MNRIVRGSLAVLAASSVGVVVSPASGAPAKPRTVDVDMEGMAYKPKSIRVKAGESITFRFKNSTNLVHEALIGDEKAQREHENMMKAMPGMSMHDDHAVTIKAGETKTLTYKFTKVGRLLVGCHQPGHYRSGMKMVVTIDPITKL